MRQKNKLTFDEWIKEVTEGKLYQLSVTNSRTPSIVGKARLKSIVAKNATVQNKK